MREGDQGVPQKSPKTFFPSENTETTGCAFAVGIAYRAFMKKDARYVSRRCWRSRVALPFACVFLLSSCKSTSGLPPVVTEPPVSTAQPLTSAGVAPAATAPAATAAPPVAAPAQAPPVPAAAVTQASWTPAALEELLAPIALYPDQLLGQILAASINSQEVMDGGNWLLENQTLTGKDLDAAAQKAGFGPAMRALFPFPTVIDMMCQQIDWTRQLGSAFNSDQKSVLDAVQRLRKEAADVGNLKSTPQQNVSTKTEGTNVYIEVKPADPQIVYVPQYDAQAVYTTPPPAPGTTTTTTTTTTSNAATSTNTAATETKKDEGVSTGTAVAIGLIGFAAGIAVGSAMNDDYYYPHWGGGVYYGGRPFYPPAYVYRPVYGPAFRPAYGYRPPVNYRNSYNNVRVNNININNNNYYNRFNNNQNLRAGNAQSPLKNSPSTRPANTASNSRGQSTYAGARNNANQPAARPAASTRDTTAANRDSARTASSSPRVDTGYGDSARTTARPSTTPSTPARTASSTPAARPTTQQAAPQRDNAFSSGQTQGSGNFQRSASTRGNASVGSRQSSGGSVRRR